MIYLFSLAVFYFSIIFNLFGETQYNITSSGKVDTVSEHLYSQKHYFKNFLITATFEDSLGNYGTNDTSVSAEYKNGEVINLQWSAKLVFQNNKIVFAKGIRKRGVDDAGVGKAILFSGQKPLNVLDNTKCNYAVKFFKKNAFAKWICQLPKESISVLQKLE